MNYSISQVAEIVGARFLNKNIYSANINEIYFDTRKGSFSRQALFLAIDSKNADGHLYIQDAYQKLNTRNFLVTKEIDISNYPEANFLLCADVVTSLQAFSNHHRKKFDLPAIGITGSNGKTIVKEWIFQIAEESFEIARSPGSYNSQLGVPLSVLQLEDHHEIGLFEAGISGENEMLHLAEIIQPSIGIFTNIGEAHSAGFDSLESKLEEKLLLFDSCQTIIYRQDDLQVHEKIKSTYADKNLVTWSFSDESAEYLVSTEILADETLIQFENQGSSTFSIPFTDEISIINAIFSIITCLEIGVAEEEISEKSRHLRSLKMRMELKKGVNNCQLINDSYSSDLNALNSALNILNQQKKKERNTLILSQIEESRLDPKVLIERLISLIQKHDIQRVLAIGPDLKVLRSQFSRRIEFEHFESASQLLGAMDRLNFQNENILIKGARKFNLESIFELLSTKVHQTILEIDLEAMRHNLMVYRSFLKQDTKLMVVLKASGYGSGSVELARFLSFQRVDYIAVAYIDEGVELRKEGITLPIMVMNPEEAGFSKMIEYKLEPEIYSLDQLQKFMSYVPGEAYSIHLKIETGMHRLGIEQHDIEQLAQMISGTDAIKIASAFSHLVGSDDKAHDEFSKQQIRNFEKTYTVLCKYIDYKPDRHILNSNGISRFPKYQYEMVRLGIGLHGLSDDQTTKENLQKVQTLKTRIAQIKEIRKGESIGYNRQFIADKSYQIATINIGYADGLPRNAGNENFEVLVNDNPAVILGNVCMDMCMIDITEISAKIGDEVIIFGAAWPIEGLAEKCGTIPYEILTRLSSRIHRIFSRE